MNAAAKAGVALAVFAAIQWDPWLRYRDLDYHEHAQLAWAHHVAAGRKPGADLVVAYGPLHPFALAGFMKATDWSVVGERRFGWAVQTAGCALLWWSLRTVCASGLAAASGMAAILLLTPAGWHAYGWADALRPALALCAMLVAIAGFRRRTRPPRVAGGALLGLAVFYSPEAGLAALAGVAVAALLERPRPSRLLDPVAGAAIALLAGFLLLCSGSPRERLGAFSEPLSIFLGGFRELPYDARGLGSLLPAILLLSTAGWIGAACAGRRDAVHAALLTFAWGAYRSVLGRSDAPHFAHAAPTALILAAWHLEQLMTFATARHPLRGARIAAVAAVSLLAGGTGAACVAASMRGSDGMKPLPGIVRSKSPAAFRMVRDQRAAGLRTWVGHPRIGGLWLSPDQAPRITRALDLLDRTTRPGDPIFATGNAEGFHFLADRPAANRYPFALLALSPDAEREVAASLSRCRAVLTDAMIDDGRRWDEWQPRIARAVRASFTPALRAGSLTVHLPRSRR